MSSHTSPVVILVSGRPMIVTDTVAEVDVFVAAWLPGTEGEVVVDVLFGGYKPDLPLVIFPTNGQRRVA